ncbi:MAG: hypothetical protein CVU40_02680 [Chloroflexi bacterium HGW-Chloroflexi-2]|nr:MAG: hypothetical protein CVU40_02680 [Chloroflexi bacterium HGW-Chloroflexi-2]
MHSYNKLIIYFCKCYILVIINLWKKFLLQITRKNENVYLTFMVLIMHLIETISKKITPLLLSMGFKV